MTGEEHRAKMVQVVEACRSIAPEALVFGSSVRAGGLPNDLDLLLHASQWDTAVCRLLAAARKFYGWIDIFLIPPEGKMLVRNPHASGWDVARHARAIRATAEAEGVKLGDFDAAWMRPLASSTAETPSAVLPAQQRTEEMDAFKKILIDTGWHTHFLDDGFGPSGWWAYKGEHDSPDLETGLFDSEHDAVHVAFDTWPGEFTEGIDALGDGESLSSDDRAFLAHLRGKMTPIPAPTA